MAWNPCLFPDLYVTNLMARNLYLFPDLCVTNLIALIVDFSALHWAFIGDNNNQFRSNESRESCWDYLHSSNSLDYDPSTQIAPHRSHSALWCDNSATWPPPLYQWRPLLVEDTEGRSHWETIFLATSPDWTWKFVTLRNWTKSDSIISLQRFRLTHSIPRTTLNIYIY